MIIPIIQAVVLLTCCGCSTITNKNRDKRLNYLTYKDLSSAVDEHKCVVLYGRGAFITNVFLGDGVPVRTIISSFSGSFIHDSLVTLVTRNEIASIPGWYERDRISEREKFLNRNVISGDVIIFPLVK